MAGTTSVTPRTTNTTLRGLEGETKWSTTSLTYAFATSADSASATAEFAAAAGETLNYLDASDASENAQRIAAVNAFTAFSRVSNLTFTAASEFASADFKIVGVDNFGAGGRSTFPGTNPKGTSTTDFESWNFFNTTSFWTTHTTETGAGSYMGRVTMHEFLHGLGIAHPHDDGHGSTAISINQSPRSTTDNPLDNERYTIMSYERGGTNSNFALTYGHALTPSALDIAVLQSFYGANTSTHTTDTTYNLTDRATTAYDGDGSDGSVSIGRGFYSIWDAGGDGDTIKYGGGQRTVASGMRNPSGLAIHPDTGALWALVQERDGLGDLIVPDFFTEVVDGGFYGFPSDGVVVCSLRSPWPLMLFAMLATRAHGDPALLVFPWDPSFFGKLL